MSNALKTTALMALLLVVVAIAFSFVGGKTFGYIGLFLGLVINLGVYWYSDKIVLSMTRAKQVSAEQNPELHEMVERLARKAGIPKPRIYIVNDNSMNAFATGRNPAHAAVAVHKGLLRSLSREEVEAIIGHELTHIANRDTLIQTFAAVIAGTLTYLGYAYMFGDRRDRGPLALVAVIVAPIAGLIIQMAISRTREYAADAGGARLSQPQYLASALAKISDSVQVNPIRSRNPATAHMYIINPFRGMRFSSLFSTHPPIDNRIRRLQDMRIT